MADQPTPDEMRAKMKKLRALPLAIAIVGAVLFFFTQIDFSISFPLICMGIALFVGWGKITENAVAKLEEQSK